MKDRLNRAAMTLERAQNIVDHVISGRARWGKLYKADDIPLDDVLDALLFVVSHDSQEVLDLRESLRVSQKQLGASKAREAKLNKVNTELREGTSADREEDA